MTRLYGAKGWSGPAPQQTIRAHEPPPDTLSTKEVATIINRSANAVCDAIYRGQLSAEKLDKGRGGGEWCVSVSSVNAYMEGRRQRDENILNGEKATDLIGIQEHHYKTLRAWLTEHDVPFHYERRGKREDWVGADKKRLIAALERQQNEAVRHIASLPMRQRIVMTTVLRYYELPERRIMQPFGRQPAREAKCVMAAIMLYDLGMAPTVVGRAMKRHHSTILSNAAATKTWTGFQEDGLQECRRYVRKELDEVRAARQKKTAERKAS